MFSQLLDFLDKDVFLRISNKYNGNRYVKFFTCWNQLAVLMFGQLSNRESLRDLALATQALSRKAFHLGLGKYPDKIRRVIYWDEESKRKFIFFTNAFSEDDRLDISPVMVAELYHNRWKIELFFKWLKQHLKIKKFWGTSENAVRIQIYSAITAYCMMAIVQKKMRIQRPIYEMLQLVSVSLTETLPLGELFDKPNNNIINELDDSSEPTLFNC